jgi:uncharacterized protein YtpQ (UPF0354 family)
LSIRNKGDLELVVDCSEKYEQTVFLDNAYREYRAAPEGLKEVLTRYARATLDSAKEAEDETIDIARVVPVIKDAAYPAEVKKHLVEAGHDVEKFDPYFERLNSELLVFYVEDSESNLRYLHRSEVSSLGLEPKALRARAVKNLQGMLPKIVQHGGPGIYMVTAGGTFEASLLLLDHLWSENEFSVKGELVVAVPSRDLLLVTGSQDADALSRVRKTVGRTVEKGGYCITAKLFVRRGGEWVVFEEQ